MVSVACTAAPGGWACAVDVDQAGRRTHHTVTVTTDELERWGRGGQVEDLVRRSFDFLLEREPASSILPRFDLAVIQRYFPEYDGEMRDG